MRLLSEIPSPKSPMPIRCNFAERLSPRQKMALSAFACASLLAGIALLTLVIKTFLEWRHGESLAAAHRH